MTDDSLFRSPKALYHTFGCKLNFAETSALAHKLADKGIVRAQKEEIPDLIIVNTCSVTELADKKCRQTIRSLAKKYPDAAVIVTGCYAQLKPQEAASLPGVVIVAGADHKLKLAEYILEWLENRKNILRHSVSSDIKEFEPSCSHGDRTRRFLKVQDGCDYWCSYCTIPLARGRSRSGKIEDIVIQAEKAAEEGAKEIVLTGVNIGDFGHRTDRTFLDLIKALDKVTGMPRYRISSIEPNLLTEDIIDFVASSRAFMPHFHIPLQSGSDKVLSLMRRRYDTALFRSRIEAIRRMIPDAFIGVDIIVGARGETPALFEDSLRFIDSLDITRLHVFPYSERPGTKALEICDYIVSQDEKHRRVDRMIALSDKKMTDFQRRFLGSIRPVLIEHTVHDGNMYGFTDNYLKVSLPADTASFNTIRSVSLKTLSPGGDVIYGTPHE